MRSTLITMALLTVVSIAAARWPTPQELQTDMNQWVRTVDGWERRSQIMPPCGKRGMLSPLVVAGFQAIGAGFALAAGGRWAGDQP